MKFEEVNWLEWPGTPSKQVFDDWVEARKSKKHPKLTHTAMSKYSKHVFKAVSEGICTLEEAFEYAAVAGWRAIMYQYLVTASAEELVLYHGVASGGQNRTTRQLSLEEELKDNSWAH